MARKKGASRSNRAPARLGNAIAMLTADHKRVQALFEEFEGARRGDQKERLAREICSELTVHAQLEEELFYPAAREAIGDEDLMDEAEVEHASAKELIAQIENGSSDDDLWQAKVTVLGEYIRHHVREEQNDMFKKVRATELDLTALGEQMQQRKQELMASTVSPRR